jgi:hypothetical protein
MRWKFARGREIYASPFCRAASQEEDDLGALVRARGFLAITMRQLFFHGKNRYYRKLEKRMSVGRDFGESLRPPQRLIAECGAEGL